MDPSHHRSRCRFTVPYPQSCRPSFVASMGPHFNRGQAFFELSKFEDAIKAYREELSANPDSALVHALISAALEAVSQVY